MNRAMLEDRRVVLGGGALVAVLLVVLTWFMLAGPQLAAADSYATQQADAETQNVALAAKNTALSRLDPQVLAGELVAAQSGLPTSTAFPAFTREVTSAADSADVELVDIAIAEPGPVVDPAVAAGTAPDPSAAAQQAVVVSLTSDGSLEEQAAFLKALQDGDRRTLVTSTQVSTNGDEGRRINSVDGRTTMTTQLTIFLSPAAA